MSKNSIKNYLSKIGRKGGSATGKRKSRGDADYYRELSRKAIAARRMPQVEPDKKDLTDTRGVSNVGALDAGLKACK